MYGEHTGTQWQQMMDSFFPVSIFILLRLYLVIIYLLSDSHHAGVLPTELNILVIPASAYAAILKECEDKDETDSEGDGLSW